MTSEWARLIVESFVIKDRRESATYTCFHKSPNFHSPTLYLVLARSLSKAILTVARKKEHRLMASFLPISQRGENNEMPYYLPV